MFSRNNIEFFQLLNDESPRTELWFLFGSVDFEKRVLKPNRPVFWSVSGYKELRITRKPVQRSYISRLSGPGHGIRTKYQLGKFEFFSCFFFCCCCFEISILEPALPLSSGTGNRSSPKPESQNIDSGLIVPAWSQALADCAPKSGILCFQQCSKFCQIMPKLCLNSQIMLLISEIMLTK